MGAAHRPKERPLTQDRILSQRGLGSITRLIRISWVLLALIAAYSIARTLAAPDGPVQNGDPIGAEFAVPSDVVALQGTSSLDTATRIGEGVRLTGWIFDQRTNAPGLAMYVDIDGVTRAQGTYGDARPDVGAAFHSPSLDAVGFHIIIGRRLTAPGTHHIRLGLRAANGFFESVRRYTIDVP